VHHHYGMKKKCDLVMKGGITSGIVYPGAVLELSKEYEFASIGGTSAGAIAAALTAAAEFRRQSGGGDEGFARLAGLPGWMAEPAGGRSRLLSLFAPTRESAPLFHALVAFIERKGTKRDKTLALLGAILRRFPFFPLVVAASGLTLMVVAAMAADHPAILVVIAALAMLTGAAALLAGVVEALVRAARTLPRQGFGISTGSVLTEWLSNEINAVAGVGQPLTFADLREKKLNLEVMTTNLTHGRPYRLPLETRHFFFDEEEMRGLFPGPVVQWMVDHAQRRDRLYALPSGELPVVVATRMSLSFPLLLSAVPLWSIDRGRREIHKPERCWFSDGGITSNFPVHFFDAPLPRWPTFAINLADRSARYHEDGQGIYMPETNRGGIVEWWTPFDDLGGFLAAIVRTMQNWRDNMLLHLPGQRDRVAHVLLASDEGGLNLTMEKETIERVAARGAEAGRALRQRFRWGNHKWIRFLSFMGALEETLERWEGGYEETRVLVEGEDPLPSYRISPAERHSIRNATATFLAHVRTNFASRPFRTPRKRPRGMPVLRVMPRE
jgi:predicted acylesterase/phospholipase RssA